MADSAQIDHILVLNAGSSSIRFAVFGPQLQRGQHGMASGIAGNGRFVLNGQGQEADFQDHSSALNHILRILATSGVSLENLRAAAHRVVHGGQNLSQPCAISTEVRAEILALADLAPLHNPANLAVIDSIAARAPHLAQFASFDTGFHTTQPQVERSYALPQEWHRNGLQRYGFHGISYSALVENHPKPLPQRLLACHLGNGASLCAIRDGKSCATTMGFSPASGLTMGSRAGDIDALAVLKIVESQGIAETRKLLNHNSGLRALGGTNDMQQLLRRTDPEATFAVAHFVHAAVRHAGAMVASMGGLDAIAFTGGIGENSAVIRAAILDGLEWLGVRFSAERNNQNAAAIHVSQSTIQVHIVPADEEIRIAQDAIALM